VVENLKLGEAKVLPKLGYDVLVRLELFYPFKVIIRLGISLIN